MSNDVQKIKELRTRTGVGMTQCKKALEEAGWDLDQAIKHLRESGLASAVKKEGREAKEGVIATASNSDRVVLVEVNAETDFVVRNDRFQEFQEKIAEEAVHSGVNSLDDFLSQKFSADPSMTIDTYRASIIQAIGENIQIRRMAVFPKKQNQSTAVYSHLGGKLVVFVELEGDDHADELAKDIAMHIAASQPEYLAPEDVPSEVINHEKEIARNQIQGKPANIVEKIVDGKVNAFYDEACLLRQKFIKNDKLTVAQLVEQKAKESGKPIKVSRFVRWNVGEKVNA